MNWKPFNPTWLVNLAKAQYPKERWLAESLGRCTQCLAEGPAYVYFVERERADSPESEWEFSRNISLRHITEGEIVLDVLRNGEIGGAEFMKKLP